MQVPLRVLTVAVTVVELVNTNIGVLSPKLTLVIELVEPSRCIAEFVVVTADIVVVPEVPEETVIVPICTEATRLLSASTIAALTTHVPAVPTGRVAVTVVPEMETRAKASAELVATLV